MKASPNYIQWQDYNIDVDNRQIFICDDSEDEGITHQNTPHILKNILYLDSLNNNRIIIHLCSMGGIWDYGMAIFDCIKQCESYTICVIHGHARSMSSIIIQAANLRLMMPNATFMIHYGDIVVEDTSKGFLTAARREHLENEIMLHIYSQRCNKTKDFIKSKINKVQEWYMDANEALRHGFIDGIIGSKNYPNLKEICKI